MRWNDLAKFLLPSLILILLAGVFGYGRNELFTKQKWDSASPEMRDRLLASLAGSGILIGKSEDELYGLLGVPDGGTRGRWTYFLGKSDGGSCQPSFVVTYGIDQTVQSQNLECIQVEAGNAIFVSDLWRNGTRQDRFSMVRNLMASRHLLGRVQDEVTDILGSPDADRVKNHLQVWYTRRYIEDGKIKKRHAGTSRCLYVDIRDGHVEKAEFVGS